MSAKKFRILIPDAAVRPEGLRLLEPVADLTMLPTYPQEAEVVRAVKDVDAILARTTKISRAVIEAADRLKIVSRHGVGVDSVDVDACTEHGVVVTITGDANSQAVSEHALGFLLAMAHRLAPANVDLKAGRWDRSQFIGVELFKKVLGIVGLGRIGSRLARQAAAFEMDILAYDPYIEPETAAKLNVTLVDLKTLLRRSDFISLHMPLTQETRHLIGATELEFMKPSAILVNTARGGLIDEQALTDVLAAGRIAGAALDAFAQEPLPPDHPLTQLDNVMCTPHIAGQTEEALIRMSVGAAENILHVLRGEVPPFVVNPEVLTNTARVPWQTSS